jgi:hypothetical protein
MSDERRARDKMIWTRLALAAAGCKLRWHSSTFFFPDEIHAACRTVAVFSSSLNFRFVAVAWLPSFSTRFLIILGRDASVVVSVIIVFSSLSSVSIHREIMMMMIAAAAAASRCCRLVYYSK